MISCLRRLPVVPALLVLALTSCQSEAPRSTRVPAKAEKPKREPLVESKAEPAEKPKAEPGEKPKDEPVIDTGKEIEEVKKVVFDGRDAALRRDFPAYMTQWSDDARLIFGRGPEPGKFDLVLDRKQIEATRRLRFLDKAPADANPTPAEVTPKVTADQAEVRMQVSEQFKGGGSTTGFLYRLRRAAGGWQVFEERSWPIELVVDDKKTVYDAATWKDMDERIEEVRRFDSTGAKLVVELLSARRYTEAHAVAKKVTGQRKAAATDWLLRGELAMQVGDVKDALDSFRKVRSLDIRIPVPEYARRDAKK
jgi:hypothetical protein